MCVLLLLLLSVGCHCRCLAVFKLKIPDLHTVTDALNLHLSKCIKRHKSGQQQHRGGKVAGGGGGEACLPGQA